MCLFTVKAANPRPIQHSQFAMFSAPIGARTEIKISLLSLRTSRADRGLRANDFTLRLNPLLPAWLGAPPPPHSPSRGTYPPAWRRRGNRAARARRHHARRPGRGIPLFRSARSARGHPIPVHGLLWEWARVLKAHGPHTERVPAIGNLPALRQLVLEFPFVVRVQHFIIFPTARKVHVFIFPSQSIVAQGNKRKILPRFAKARGGTAFRRALQRLPCAYAPH